MRVGWLHLQRLYAWDAQHVGPQIDSRHGLHWSWGKLVLCGLAQCALRYSVCAQRKWYLWWFKTAFFFILLLFGSAGNAGDSRNAKGHKTAAIKILAKSAYIYFCLKTSLSGASASHHHWINRHENFQQFLKTKQKILNIMRMRR